MDIRFLTTFLEVADTRHFGRAAENLYLTQSAVSARIKLLEEYFNTALFIRNRNSIQITPAGEKLIPFARELSETLARTRKSLAEEECQHISCASTPHAFQLCFCVFLPQLLAHFDAVSFRHEIVTIEQITRQLHEHSVDFALSTTQVKSDDVNSVLLFEIELSLYQSDASDNASALDINIEWPHTISDKILKMYPEFKKAKLRTSSLDVALSMAKSQPSRLILPSLNSDHLTPELIKLLSRFSSTQLSDDICVPVYLNQLKNQNNVGVDEVISFLQSLAKQAEGN